MMDWGETGLTDTIAALHEVGLKTVGAGENLHAARQPAFFMRNSLRIAFLGYCMPEPWNATPAHPGTAPIDRDLILEDMHLLRDKVDLLIVSLHAGILSDYPNPEDRRLARALVDNGADLILGHGSHMLQGVETYHGCVIAHSLGNFVADPAAGNVETRVALQEQQESIILDVTLTRHRTLAMSFIPTVTGKRFQALPANPEEAVRILTTLDTLSKNLERMNGPALWKRAGALNVEHGLRVLAFQTREVGWLYALKRLKKVRWRHFRLLLGYLMVKAKE